MSWKMFKVKRKYYTLERTTIAGVRQYITADFCLNWTTEFKDALQLARRKDADDLATICDDADYVGTYETLDD